MNNRLTHPERSSYHASLHLREGLCLPYTVVVRPSVGRCVVATRDISAGELVLADFSVAAGPKEFGTPGSSCVICLAPASSVPPCGACGLRLCGRSSCIRRHEEEECAPAFSKWMSLGQPSGECEEDFRYTCLKNISGKFLDPASVHATLPIGFRIAELALIAYINYIQSIHSNFKN